METSISKHDELRIRQKVHNAQIVRVLYIDREAKGELALTAEDLLRAGWKGPLPTKILQNLENHSIKKVGEFYSLVRVEGWMKDKSQEQLDPNRPLPLDTEKIKAGGAKAAFKKSKQKQSEKKNG